MSVYPSEEACVMAANGCLIGIGQVTCPICQRKVTKKELYSHSQECTGDINRDHYKTSRRIR
jgi:hypothetical protein